MKSNSSAIGTRALRALSLFGALVFCLLLAACASDSEQEARSIEPLVPCTASGSIFAKDETKNAIESWPGLYHSRVSAAVESHINQLWNMNQSPLMCTAPTFSSVQRPSGALRSIVVDLPHWKKVGIMPSEADIGSVLLEFLRTYECSMLERQAYLGVILTQTGSLTRGEFNMKYQKEIDLIRKELAVARPALESTLVLIGGLDRMRPFTQELICLERAALDMRNVLGLAADAATCMPRTWNVRGSLRDLKEFDL